MKAMSNTEIITEYAESIRRSLRLVWNCGASLRDYIDATGDGGYSDLAVEQLRELCMMLSNINFDARAIERVCDDIDKGRGF